MIGTVIVDYQFGVLPVLEVDGEQVGQSQAIALYLATQFGKFAHSDFRTLQSTK